MAPSLFSTSNLSPNSLNSPLKIYLKFSYFMFASTWSIQIQTPQTNRSFNFSSGSLLIHPANHSYSDWLNILQWPQVAFGIQSKPSLWFAGFCMAKLMPVPFTPSFLLSSHTAALYFLRCNKFSTSGPSQMLLLFLWEWLFPYLTSLASDLPWPSSAKYPL